MPEGQRLPQSRMEKAEIIRRKGRETMNENAKEYVTGKVNELLNASTCCAELKAAAQSWLDAVGTDKEAEKTKELIAEVEADIMPIEGLIAFAGSEGGAKVFGEAAPNVLAHAQKVKEDGGRYCDCPACAACEAILEKKDELL